jgi:predicted metal-binding protein
MTVSELPNMTDGDAQNGASTIIYVCTTCRQPGEPDVSPRPGVAFAAATARAAENSGVIVRPLRCLANCKRGCTAAMRRTDTWTYVFGNLDPNTDAEALVQGAQLLANSADGLMPWRGRPDALKRGLIARVPPIDFFEMQPVTVIEEENNE